MTALDNHDRDDIRHPRPSFAGNTGTLPPPPPPAPHTHAQIKKEIKKGKILNESGSLEIDETEFLVAGESQIMLS